MKVKLDENLGSRGAEFLRSRGFDVLTVGEQGLLRAQDEQLLHACTAEGRCLITLDMDFSNPLRHRPADHAGIIVIRIPGRLRLPVLERALAVVVQAWQASDVRGHLWIAEVDKLREHLPREP